MNYPKIKNLFVTQSLLQSENQKLQQKLTKPLKSRIVCVITLSELFEKCNITKLIVTTNKSHQIFDFCSLSQYLIKINSNSITVTTNLTCENGEKVFVFIEMIYNNENIRITFESKVIGVI